MVRALLVLLFLVSVGFSGFLKTPRLEDSTGEEVPGDYEVFGWYYLIYSGYKLQVTDISETTWRTGWKSLVFKAFGETYNLHLHPSHLLAPQVGIHFQEVKPFSFRLLL